MNKKKFLLDTFKKAAICRHFENYLFEIIQNKKIKYPVYLSAGQEYIASTLSTIIKSIDIKPLIFAQHRSHSTYISYRFQLL